MASSAVYDPEQWNNFFVLVGTGSAALTGLVFVAMSINLKAVANDATHTYRAINMLSGFTAVFILGSLALMGHQTYRTLGIEWLIVAAFAAAINTNGYVQAFRLVGSRYALGPIRIVGGSACYLGQIVGSLMLFSGSRAGIYVAAISLIVNFYFMVSGSWLLIVGTLQSPISAPPSPHARDSRQSTRPASPSRA
jgi:modulator of FtsH protease